MVDGYALVAIDMQEVFRRPDSGWFVPRYDEAARRIGQLIPLFGDRVVLTRFVSPDEPVGAWAGYYRRFPFAVLPEHDPLYRLSGDFATSSCPVVTMTTFGKWGPDLAAAIPDGHGVVLTGVSTDCCVLATALAAADAGMQVKVVADACAGVTDTDHQRALDAMALFSPLIEITTTADVQRELAD
ncbi:hydrolase [Mycobacterium dioxanotrophicus]|jgi:nicotinamidase-related amidase|uniref:Hydrolase n=1 Tax=Mycobacterium dioxanotrophicus TaxID=482462 RepID=A0A1Y0C494_9MYCO|nr:isochorismatase family protein [Mycobacterium dioxanotrophicus]ART70013.1 hydrolase [Mycobacterium dioxanotrophicus]